VVASSQLELEQERAGQARADVILWAVVATTGLGARLKACDEKGAPGAQPGSRPKDGRLADLTRAELRTDRGAAFTSQALRRDLAKLPFWATDNELLELCRLIGHYARLKRLGKLPIALELVSVQACPLPSEAQRPAGQLSVGVKCGGGMIGPVHVDHDPVERRQAWHRQIFDHVPVSSSRTLPAGGSLDSSNLTTAQQATTRSVEALPGLPGLLQSIRALRGWRPEGTAIDLAKPSRGRC